MDNTYQYCVKKIEYYGQIDVGVLFDEKLTFKEHIQEKISTAYMMLSIIKRNFKSI